MSLVCRNADEDAACDKQEDSSSSEETDDKDDDDDEEGAVTRIKPLKNQSKAQEVMWDHWWKVKTCDTKVTSS